MPRPPIPWRNRPPRARGLIELRAELRHIRPAIWRSFVVHERTSLAKLHRVLQTLFDWEDRHLHCFTFGKLVFAPAPPLEGEFHAYEPLGDDYKGLTLAHFELEIDDRFGYTYDMGDDWTMELTVKHAQDGARPLWSWCTGGGRAAPPEDCGGPHMYEMIVKSLVDGWDPDNEWLKDALPKHFDPAAFNLKAINGRMVRLR